MHDLGKPDPLLLQAKRHMSCLVGPRRHLCCRVRAVHCYDQCGGKRAALVSQSEWKILSGAQGVSILFRDEFQGAAHRFIDFVGSWRYEYTHTLKAVIK